jgi:hypothetical protein
MTDTALTLPYDVEGVIVDLVARRHVEHMAKLERQRGVAVRTFQTYSTIVRMSDAQGIRLSGDTTPSLLVGIVGVPGITRNEDDCLDLTFQLGMQITVLGQRRRDVLLKRDAFAWTTIECIYQRLPRHAVHPITAPYSPQEDGRLRTNQPPAVIRDVELMDYEPLSDGDTQRTVGDVRMVWEVGVANAISIRGGFPVDDSAWPPEAGGAPVAPYDPQQPWPGAQPEVEVDREPISERPVVR